MQTVQLTAQQRIDLAFGEMVRMLEHARDADARQQEIITSQAQKIKTLEAASADTDEVKS